MSPTEFPVGDCKTTILEKIGSIQAAGALVAIRTDNHRVEYCSENCAAFLGIAPADLVGLSGSEWLGSRWPDVLALASREGILEWSRFQGVHELTLVGHRRGAHLILEFEPEAPSGRNWWTHSARARFVEQLAQLQTPLQCSELLVNSVFEQSGYHRAMMYRFLPNWDGEVVYESCQEGVEGYLGLRFPASDIPPNARQLFTLNHQRMIADINVSSSPLLNRSGEKQALDLTYSTLRSVHPAHLEYLKNMGVCASLTLSVLTNGTLWGMVACHHFSARSLPIADRLAFEEMAALVSLHLTNVVRLAEHKTHADLRGQLSRLQGALSAEVSHPRLALSNNLGIVREAFAASGAWLRFEGEDFLSGDVPDKRSRAPLRDFLEIFPRDTVSHYDGLPPALRRFRNLSMTASGVLFIPVNSADFVVLTRPEIVETLNWAGKPQGLGDQEAVGEASPLTPRNSFALWSELVRDTSAPWTRIELELSAELRDILRAFIGNALLEKIASHDPLTGLANRLLLDQRLQQEVRTSIESDSSFAVHMIDLDHFKEVNDTLGHEAGDRVLIEVGKRLTGLVAAGDTVARPGGDEFSVLQTAVSDRKAAVAMAERIVHAISEPFQILGQDVRIGASVGISICPSDTVEQSELLRCADMALYQVKRSGRNAYSMYVPGMKLAKWRPGDGDLLTMALRNNEFRLKYQPIVDARSGELRGFEAFLRWCRPGEPERNAGEFMPMLEERHLTPAVGEWVLDTVFKQYQQWQLMGLVTVPISVNIGAAEFAADELIGSIEKAAARYGTGWQWLRLDIKEQTLVADVEHAMRRLSALRDAGVGTNLDNFGHEILPIGYLRQLPFQGIKLDGMLFQDQSDRQGFSALFNVVHSIARVFSAQLTVTRIETPQMREALMIPGIDLVQGFAIADPAEADQCTEWLRHPEILLP